MSAPYDIKALLAALPQPPDYRYDWPALAALPPIRKLMDGMAQTQQNPAWHGEGDVLTHTRMVCRELAGLAEFRALADASRQALALAALLHDIGKITCTQLEDGVLTSPRHGPVGAQQARVMLWTDFGLSGDPCSQQLREAVCHLIRYHTQPLHLYQRKRADTRARQLAAIGQNAPAFSLRALCLLSEADMRGRIADDTPEKLETIGLTRLLAEESGCLNGPYPFRSAHTARALFAGGNVWADQELYDDTWGEVTLLCGLPGTGKDTWIAANAPDLPTVCLDDIRRSLHLSSEDNQGRVVQAARERARGFLRQHQPFILNATHVTSQRSQWITLCEQYGARVRVLWLETAWEENLRRNAARPSSVPEAVIGRMLEKLEPPLPGDAERVDWVCV